MDSKYDNQIITVIKSDTNKAKLTFYDKKIKIFETEAFIGRNGMTTNKTEGDGKTPEGIYELGLAFGIHDKEDIKMCKNIKYMKINKNLYWVDDIQSKYYNQMVDITKVNKDWKSAEDLIKYPKQYEYAIEIKTNKRNVPGKGSAIFLHCSINRPTSGCIAINREKMIELYERLEENTIIYIGK